MSDSPTPRLLGVALLTVSVTVVLLQIYIQDHTTPANFLPYQIFEAIATGVAQTYVFWSFFTAVFPAAFFPFRKSVALILPLKVLSRVSMSFGWPLTLSVILAFSYCVASLVLSFFMPAYRSREIWLANPSHSQWRLRITIAQTALGAMLATSVAVLDPLTSSIIFLFCLPVYSAVALYTMYYDSKSQREKVREGKHGKCMERSQSNVSRFASAGDDDKRRCNSKNRRSDFNDRPDHWHVLKSIRQHSEHCGAPGGDIMKGGHVDYVMMSVDREVAHV